MKNQSIKKANFFFNWFARLGGEVHLISTEETVSKLSNPIFLVSTFKNRSEEVKQNYNHKFQER